MSVRQPLLRFGSTGAPVRHLQGSLNRLSPTALPLLAEDGAYGIRTLGRVLEFQRGAGLVPDGIVGPMTWGDIATLIAALGKSDPFDRNYRLPRPVELVVSVVYLPSFHGTGAIAEDNFAEARTFFKKYNISLHVWPAKGEKKTLNTLNDPSWAQPVQDTREEYRRLRREVDAFLHRAGAPGRDSGALPVIFCEFVARAKAITPHSTANWPQQSPACLISISGGTVPDDLCIAHEMGHAALYPLHHHNSHPKNLMNGVATPARDFLFRYQVEAFARATFAR
jgi:hypothetical protein